MRADLHTHSLYSFDGDPSATVAAMCEAAIAAGLTHLAITDHCDIDGELDGIYRPLDRDAAFAAITEAKKIYADRLTLLAGLELGQAHHRPEAARAVLERHPYDIVLGSLHNLEGERDFYFFDFKSMTSDAIAAYFDRVLAEYDAMLDFPGIQVLTHITYVHRYVRRAGKELDFIPFIPRITALFEKLIVKGIALELNTSTIGPDGKGEPMPTKELLALYRRCGGRLVSLGSDGHAPDAVARHFDHAARILTECGFTELAVPTAQGLLTLPI